MDVCIIEMQCKETVRCKFGFFMPPSSESDKGLFETEMALFNEK